MKTPETSEYDAANWTIIPLKHAMEYNSFCYSELQNKPDITKEELHLAACSYLAALGHKEDAK